MLKYKDNIYIFLKENEIEFLAQVGNITSVFKSVSKYIILNIE